MKKHSLFVSVLLILSLLIMATPVAANGNDPVGDRIGLYYGGAMEFPAGVPFHIRHGFVQTSEDDAIGIFDFKVEVDGVLLQEDFKMFYPVSGDPDVLYRFWGYNFPDGMTGEHTFTGHWFAPCQFAVNWMDYPGPCATPNAKVETNTQTLTITFVP